MDRSSIVDLLLRNLADEDLEFEYLSFKEANPPSNALLLKGLVGFKQQPFTSDIFQPRSSSFFDTERLSPIQPTRPSIFQNLLINREYQSFQAGAEEYPVSPIVGSSKDLLQNNSCVFTSSPTAKDIEYISFKSNSPKDLYIYLTGFKRIVQYSINVTPCLVFKFLEENTNEYLQEFLFDFINSIKNRNFLDWNMFEGILAILKPYSNLFQILDFTKFHLITDKTLKVRIFINRLNNYINQNLHKREAIESIKWIEVYNYLACTSPKAMNILLNNHDELFAYIIKDLIPSNSLLKIWNEAYTQLERFLDGDLHDGDALSLAKEIINLPNSIESNSESVESQTSLDSRDYMNDLAEAYKNAIPEVEGKEGTDHEYETDETEIYENTEVSDSIRCLFCTKIGHHQLTCKRLQLLVDLNLLKIIKHRVHDKKGKLVQFELTPWYQSKNLQILVKSHFRTLKSCEEFLETLSKMPTRDTKFKKQHQGNSKQAKPRDTRVKSG